MSTRTGVITCGEMRRALTRAALADSLMASPHAPGGGDAMAFLRWRSSEAARVCVSASEAGELRGGRNLFATVPDRDEPSALWLPRGSTFSLRGPRFRGGDGVRLHDALESTERP